MRTLPALALGFLMSQSPVGSVANLDAKNGFRDATFERSAGNFHDLRCPNGNASEKNSWCQRTNDKLAIGNYALKKIDYHFYKGKLASIHIEFIGYKNSIGIQKTLEAAYGPGKTIATSTDGKQGILPHLSWEGGKVKMIMTPSFGVGTYDVGTIKISGISIMNRINMERAQEKKQNLNSAIKDL